MKDNEIIRILERAGLSNGSAIGHHSGTADIIADRFIELLDENNHQKAEIEMLKQEFDFAKAFYNETQAELKLLRYKYQKALEKQIPRKPEYEGDGYDDNGNIIYDTGYCPNCRYVFETDYESAKYCPECGQAWDRSDEE